MANEGKNVAGWSSCVTCNKKCGAWIQAKIFVYLGVKCAAFLM